MIRLKHIWMLGLFLITLLANAQMQEDWLKLGDQAIAENDPYGALLYFEKAMEMDSSKGAVNYKYAEALRLNHDYKKAAFYYLKVFKRERAKVFEMSGIHLATMQKQSGQYTEAKQNWRRVRDQFEGDKSGYWYQKAVQEMRACDLAPTWISDSLNSFVKPLSAEINTDASEFAGHFDNASQLYFSSLKGSFNLDGELTSNPDDYLTKIYESDSALSSFTIYKAPIDSANWHYYEESSDGKHAVYVKQTNNANTIYVVDQQSQQIVLSLPAQGDTAWYSHPSFGIIDNQDVLFFASNREGGIGQSDIWYTSLHAPVNLINLGENVNTPGNEITPHFRGDRNSVFFSSDWHYGFGGYDIFESEVTGSQFGFSTNLRMPLNSPSNDIYYHFNAETKHGCITTNRAGVKEGSINCCNDLWVFDESLPDKTLPIIRNLEDLNAYLPVTLFFHNDAPDARTRSETTTQNYLETYRNYTQLIPEYRNHYRSGLNDSKGNKAEDEMDGFFTESVDKGVADLDLFARLLKTELDKGSQIEITIKGFASPLAETSYNVSLTQRRISSLENFLNAYHRGSMQEYIAGTATNGGHLLFNNIPFGEYVAKEYVSDNPNEEDAIYSINAAKERKIEITSVQRASSTETQLDLRFETEIINLGQVKAGETISFSFPYQKANTTILNAVHSEASNVNLTLNPTSVSGEIKIGTDIGKQNVVLIVEGDFADSPKELHLTFEL